MTAPISNLSYDLNNDQKVGKIPKLERKPKSKCANFSRFTSSNPLSVAPPPAVQILRQLGNSDESCLNRWWTMVGYRMVANVSDTLGRKPNLHDLKALQREEEMELEAQLHRDWWGAAGWRGWNQGARGGLRHGEAWEAEWTQGRGVQGGRGSSEERGRERQSDNPCWRGGGEGAQWRAEEEWREKRKGDSRPTEKRWGSEEWRRKDIEPFLREVHPEHPKGFPSSSHGETAQRTWGGAHERSEKMGRKADRWERRQEEYYGPMNGESCFRSDFVYAAQDRERAAREKSELERAARESRREELWRGDFRGAGREGWGFQREQGGSAMPKSEFPSRRFGYGVGGAAGVVDDISLFDLESCTSRMESRAGGDGGESVAPSFFEKYGRTARKSERK